MRLRTVIVILALACAVPAKAGWARWFGVSRPTATAAAASGAPFTNYYTLRIWYPWENALTNAAGKITNAAPNQSANDLTSLWPAHDTPTWLTNIGGCVYFDGNDAISNDTIWWANSGTYTAMAFMAFYYFASGQGGHTWCQDSGGTQRRMPWSDASGTRYYVTPWGTYSKAYHAGEWCHLAFVMDKRNYENSNPGSSHVRYEMYRDGVLQESSYTTTNGSSWQTAPGVIGKNPNASGYYGTFKITDIMMFTNYPCSDNATVSNFIYSVYTNRAKARGLL
jgi:hypothetical protein